LLSHIGEQLKSWIRTRVKGPGPAGRAQDRKAPGGHAYPMTAALTCGRRPQYTVVSARLLRSPVLRLAGDLRRSPGVRLGPPTSWSSPPLFDRRTTWPRDCSPASTGSPCLRCRVAHRRRLPPRTLSSDAARATVATPRVWTHMPRLRSGDGTPRSGFDRRPTTGTRKRSRLAQPN
jgi:hypothetical protein